MLYSYRLLLYLFVVTFLFSFNILNLECHLCIPHNLVKSEMFNVTNFAFKIKIYFYVRGNSSSHSSPSFITSSTWIKHSKSLLNLTIFVWVDSKHSESFRSHSLLNFLILVTFFKWQLYKIYIKNIEFRLHDNKV